MQLTLNMGNRIKEINKLVEKQRSAREKVQQEMAGNEGVAYSRERRIQVIDELNEITDGSLKELEIEAFQHETLEALEDGQYPLEAWTTEKIDGEWKVVPDENKVMKMYDEVAKFSRKRDKVRKDGKATIEQMILQGRWNGNAD